MSMNIGKYAVGTIHKTNSYGDIEIIEEINSKERLIKFTKTGYTKKVPISSICVGSVKDNTSPSVCGVGVVGDRYPISINGVGVKDYMLWRDMLKRCYSSNSLQTNPTYLECCVSENFKYYSFFYEWCNSQIGFGGYGWQLDKDILVKGNKVYSEHSCVFVPQELNTLFVKSNKRRGKYPIGVTYSRGMFISKITKGGKRNGLGCFNTVEEAFQAYKEAKEYYIKVVADKWKDSIDPRVYKAMYEYEVEWDD